MVGKEDIAAVLHKALCSKLALATVNKQTHRNINLLKPEQVLALYKAAESNVLITLPTGYGKSLIFELLPHFMFFLTEQKTAVVIVSPLNAIINEKLNMYGESACHVSKSVIDELRKSEQSAASSVSESLNRFCQGHFTYLIGHPEDLLHVSILDMLQLSTLNNLISHIIVDEAHCVVSWGKNFRPKYQELGMLRAQLYNSKVLALTATASEKMRREIVKCLHFSENYETVNASPDRPNIMFVVDKRQATTGSADAEISYKDILTPLFHDLSSVGVSYPRTIVYVKLKWCGYAHELASKILGDKLKHYTDGQMCASVAQYHAPQLQEVSSKFSSVRPCFDLISVKIL